MHKVQLQPCLVIIWELFPFPNQGDQFGNWLVPKVISMLDPSLTQFSTRIAPVSLGWEFTNISCVWPSLKVFLKRVESVFNTPLAAIQWVVHHLSMVLPLHIVHLCSALTRPLFVQQAFLLLSKACSGL